YLVRALNEFASLMARSGLKDFHRTVSATIQSESTAMEEVLVRKHGVAARACGMASRRYHRPNRRRMAN
ncbi:MAG: hypothetical protein ACRD6N_00200, partial [Pyrinomonadaceae bacterium]